MMNKARMLGLLIGVVVGLIICVFVFRLVNKDKKMRTEYDERQEQARGKAYKYSFVAVLIAEALLGIIASGVEIPAVPIVTHFFVIFIGVVVQACVSIWNGAYVGQNTNMTRFMIVMMVVTAINFLTALMAYRTGELVVDGVLQAPFVNFLCGMLFVVIAAAYGLRALCDRREE